MSLQSKGESIAAAEGSISRFSRADWLLGLALVALSVLVFFIGLGSYGILDPSDGYYSEGAREMIELNSSIVPYLGYKVWLEKPILIYWTIIASYKLFGISALAARLPSALSAVLCVVSVFALSLRFIGRRAALFSALMLISCPLFVAVGHLSLTDMELTLFMTVSLLSLFHRIYGGGLLWLGLAYPLLALVALSKGPQHVALVAVIICSYLFLITAKTGKRWYEVAWQYALQLHPIAGVALIAVLSLPIYIAGNIATGGEFFQEFFVRQMLGRAAGTANHQNPWHYYFPFFAGGFFPWWLLPVFAPRLIRRLFVQRRRNAARAQLPLFCVCWTVVTLVVFQLLTTKLGTYILPAAPPLAILCGWSADRLLRLRTLRPLITLALTVFVSTIVAAFLPQTGHFLDSGSSEFKVLALGGVTALAFGWLACLALIAVKRANLALLLAQLSTVCGVAAGTLAATCIYDTIEYKPSREVYQYCARQPNANIALFMRSSPAAYFYLRRRMSVLNFKTDLESFVRTTPGPHLLIVTDDVLWIVAQRAAHLKELNRHGKCSVFCLDP